MTQIFPRHQKWVKTYHGLPAGGNLYKTIPPGRRNGRHPELKPEEESHIFILILANLPAEILFWNFG